MATTNPVTGDAIMTKPANDSYRENYDRIFAKKCEKCGDPVKDHNTDCKSKLWRKRQGD